jgi:aerobic carbon-monoxide dehydrogenase small subunit
VKIALTVNGTLVNADVAPRTSLADFLREELLLTGTHLGCEHGICGACTVEIDGEIARSCITLAVACDGASVRSIEAFDDDALMGRLRDAFREEHALQCGYCTPGMLIAARDLVRRKRGLSRAEIRCEMSGNLCRCTGYMGIVSAIERTMAHTSAHEAPAPVRTRAWLGPAPGAHAAEREASHDIPATRPAPARAAAASLPRRHGRTPVHVTVGAMEEHGGGGVRLTQSFALAHPRDAVWRLMADAQAVARCMPGAELDGLPDENGRIAGRINVNLGPIAASFAGEGQVEQFPADFRQVIAGRGGDRKSGSRVSGSVDYRLSTIPGESGAEATRVDIAIAYSLTGMLAQFGRSTIARDLALRLGEAFAQNIDAQLADPSAAPKSPAQLGAVSLLFQVLAARWRALLDRLFGSRPGAG